MTLHLDHTHETDPTPALCRYCCHLVGQTHGGNYLACAMHPYGPTGDSCPDYEKLSPTTKRTTKTLPYQSLATPDPWEVPENALDRWAMVRRMVGAMHQVVEDLRQ
jgi:hypothetical protein